MTKEHNLLLKRGGAAMGGGSGDSNAAYQEIASSLPNSRVLFSEPMSNHTSFRIGGPCDLLVIPGTRDDAIRAWLMCRELRVPCHIIGNGTNLLVRDGGVSCLLYTSALPYALLSLPFLPWELLLR